MSDQSATFTSKLPGKAVDTAGDDLVAPTAHLLRGLGLLPKAGESAGPSAILLGTPDSVAVIEAGALSLSKWWAAGLGASALALWVRVGTWWPNQDPDIQVALLLATAIATAAIALGLAYIVGSDVRGRAAATVSTLEARSSIARSLITEASALYTPDAPPAVAQIVPLSPPLPMKWITRKGADEPGWIASAMRFQGDKVQYWLAKGATQEWVSAGEVELT